MFLTPKRKASYYTVLLHYIQLVLNYSNAIISKNEYILSIAVRNVFLVYRANSNDRSKTPFSIDVTPP